MSSGVGVVSAPDPVSAAATHESEQQAFVNTGLRVWLERRRRWTQRTTEEVQRRTPRKRTYSPAVTPEQVLSFTPFPKPVPLEDVIEVLTEVWEDEEY